MIDVDFYEDESIPADWRDRFPDWLVGVGFKIQKDILRTLSRARSEADAVTQAIEYLMKNGLHDLEPIQVSLLKADSDSFLYHDWLQELRVGSRQVPPFFQVIGTNLYSTLTKISASQRGLCVWEDFARNDQSIAPFPRSNLGLFLRSAIHGIQTFIELHWGSSLERYEQQVTRFRDLVRPLRVEIVDTSQILLAKLLANPEEIYHLGPERFEYLVQDRIAAMGFSTIRTGTLYKRDGGVDLLFWNELAPFPFLGAAQVKYHASPDKKTGSPDVHKFIGAIGSLPISIGVMVTNTSFTYDAHWVAQRLTMPVRLRDQADLRLWIAGHFVDKDEYREISRKIELCHGVWIDIQKQA
jgi:hypothetical protein